MNVRAFVWATAIYIPLLFSGLGLYTLLNFGPVGTNAFRDFFETADTFLVGLDAALILEFILLVVLFPLFLAAWLWRMSASGQIRGVGALILALAASALALFVFFQAIETTPESQSWESGNRLPENNLIKIVLPDEVEANIVHIFVESLSSELSFSNETTTEPIEMLTQAMGQGSVTGSIPWDPLVPPNTINGVSLSLCGVKYLPDSEMRPASCLPELLHSQGYDNVFFQSASGEFQNKQEFLEAISFKVYERETWQSIGALDPDSSWGQSINDGRLFNHGRAILRSLDWQNQPFYLVGLSLDTHYPHSVPSYCIQNNESWVKKSYLCSLEVISNFVLWSKDNATAPTLLIIQGDHPAPEALSVQGFKASDDIYFSAICVGTPNILPSLPESFYEIPNFISEAAASCK